MSQFKPYPAYKDSGIEWADQLPADWISVKLKRVARLQSGEFITSESIDVDGDYPVYGGNGLRGYTDTNTHEGEYALIGRQGALCGNINYSKGSFWASEHAVVVYPEVGIITRWLGELLRSMNLGQYSVSAAQPGLSVERIADLFIPVPTQLEQTQIARFLDYETARIDALIEEQKHLIELLKEKRQAVISHTVTKGLDPTVPMKDSGVEWLGQVPAHWVVKKLGFLGEAIIGLTYSPDDVVSQGVLVLRSSNVQEGKLCFDDNVFVSKVISEKLMVKQGDILICSRNGSRALIGKNALIDKSADGMTFGAFMTVFRSPINNFLHQVFNSSIFSAQSGSFMTSTVNQLTTGNLNSFLIPVPPRSEQLIITKKLLSFRADFEDLISEALASVKLLQERRSALISAAVTGKIDVRDWQPPTDNSAPSAAAQKTCLEAV